MTPQHSMTDRSRRQPNLQGVTNTTTYHGVVTSSWSAIGYGDEAIYMLQILHLSGAVAASMSLWRSREVNEAASGGRGFRQLAWVSETV